MRERGDETIDHDTAHRAFSRVRVRVFPACYNKMTTITLPTSHLVVYHTTNGPSSVIKSARLPLPSRPPHHLLVRVRAMSVNPKDWKGRKKNNPHGVLSCLGEDFSGDVVGCDESSIFSVGDRIFSMMNMLEWRGNTRFFSSDGSYVPMSRSRKPETMSKGLNSTTGDKADEADEADKPLRVRWGASSEYTVVDERFAAHLPLTVSYVDGASVPLASLTAYQNLKKVGLDKGRNSLVGKHVLVHAGAGGVGTWAIQLAKWGGAYVSCTCSPRNFALVKSLGCDRPIDYNVERFEKIDWSVEGGGGDGGGGKPPDVVLDLMGGDYELRSLSLLPKQWLPSLSTSETSREMTSGHYLHVLNSGWETYFQHSRFQWLWPMVWIGNTVLQVTLSNLRVLPYDYSLTIVAPSGVELQRIGELMESGECRPVIDSVVKFSAEGLRAAHDKSEGGHCRGKIVLVVGGGGGGGGRANL